MGKSKNKGGGGGAKKENVDKSANFFDKWGGIDKEPKFIELPDGFGEVQLVEEKGAEVVPNLPSKDPQPTPTDLKAPTSNSTKTKGHKEPLAPSASKGEPKSTPQSKPTDAQPKTKSDPKGEPTIDPKVGQDDPTEKGPGAKATLGEGTGSGRESKAPQFVPSEPRKEEAQKKQSGSKSEPASTQKRHGGTKSMGEGPNGSSTSKSQANADPNFEEGKPKSDGKPQGDCEICGHLAKMFCSCCKHVFYCTREHQKKHWKSHKEDCSALKKLPYRVERNGELGRHLVATTDIPAGTHFLNESPMVMGPRQMSKPVCLGCHKELVDLESVVKCSRCLWPLCSRKCEDSKLHEPECRVIKYGGSKVNVESFGQVNMMYACITVLRALALQDGAQTIWKDYTKFESHLDKRMETEIYTKVNKEKVVYFIHYFLKLINKYSDLEILETCGRLDTNCFEIKQNGMNLRAMYRVACIISHDCCPNTKHTFDPDHSINLFATTNIRKGSIISATYTQSIWNTMNRRAHLYMSKCFWCQCRRCRDPTEFGTYLSANSCNACGGQVIPTQPLDNSAKWALQLEGNEAELDKLTMDDIFALRIITGTSDFKLREELLRQEKATKENFYKVAITWESAANVQRTLAHPHEVSVAAVSSYKKNKSYHNPKPEHKSKANNYGHCHRCGNKGEHPLRECYAKDAVCQKCQKIGHITSACYTGQYRPENQRSHSRGRSGSRPLDRSRPRFSNRVDIKSTLIEETFEENLEHLKEAFAILQVEPDEKDKLGEQMKGLAKALEEVETAA
eukprot:maker-scaffold352_size199037-snap-gene-0.46 protein:Tk08719 transcript:maker-scaffold352_size199037-snap-gene-0.46-mRNA-1 annotation:"protein isoform a"